MNNYVNPYKTMNFNRSFGKSHVEFKKSKSIQ